MASVSCVDPECGYQFSEDEIAGQSRLRCPRCARERALPEDHGDGPLPRLELDPPPLPIPSAAHSQGIQEGAGNPGSTEHIPEAFLDIAQGYYLLMNDRRVGPMDKSKLLAAGLDHSTLIWYPGAKGWRPAWKLEGLQDLLHYVPPPPPGAASWGGTAFLPAPKTYHTLYWWYFWASMAGLFFLVLMITFLILWQNVRTFGVDHRGAHITSRNSLYEVLAIFAGMTAFLFGMTSMVLFLTLLYQMWKPIQDNHVQVTPGTAVGLLLVPVFNFYWIFVAIMGLAKQSNLYIQRHGIAARPAPVGLAVATCICMLIPWVNIFVTIPLLLVTTAMLKNTAADIVEARLSEET